MAASATLSGSEDIDQLVFRRRAQAAARLQCIAAHDEIDRAAENAGQFAADAAHLEGAQQRFPARGTLIEIDHHIDVAFGRRRVARDGAEQIGVHDPERGKALAVLTQTSQGFIAAHDSLYQAKRSTSLVGTIFECGVARSFGHRSSGGLPVLNELQELQAG